MSSLPPSHVQVTYSNLKTQQHEKSNSWGKCIFNFPINLPPPALLLQIICPVVKQMVYSKSLYSHKDDGPQPMLALVFQIQVLFAGL